MDPALMQTTPVMGAGEPATSTPTEAPPEERTRTLDETLPPHTVVLHNDDVNEMNHVVQALLQSVPELSTERAVEVMLAAHEHGQADVLSCPLERAELYRDRLESHGLTATINRG